MKNILLRAVLCAVVAASPVWAAGVYMRAKQPFYGTEFDVYRTEDMPANWFKTYDGYCVTRRLDTNWVYGMPAPHGMELTDILVGSVDPHTVPELNQE